MLNLYFVYLILKLHQLNLFFVIVLHWGVFGVGLATTVSQVVSAVLVIRCLLKGTGSIKLVPKELKINKDKMVRIMKIGIPAGLQGVLFAISIIYSSSI